MWEEPKSPFESSSPLSAPVENSDTIGSCSIEASTVTCRQKSRQHPLGKFYEPTTVGNGKPTLRCIALSKEMCRGFEGPLYDCVAQSFESTTPNSSQGRVIAAQGEGGRKTKA